MLSSKTLQSSLLLFTDTTLPSDNGAKLWNNLLKEVQRVVMRVD